MSITTWTRLEPDIMTGNPETDLTAGVAATLADPLWLIGRQWQMGELSGEDAGSPVQAHIKASFALFDRIALPKQVPFDRVSMIAEELVERAPGIGDPRTRKAGWTSFQQRLVEAQIGSAAGRVPSTYPAQDGDAILEDFDQDRLADKLGMTGSVPFGEVARNWAGWYRSRAATARNPAWDSNRLTYDFSMTAPLPNSLGRATASDHYGGRLDWDSFTLTESTRARGPDPTIAETAMAPALLDAPGMPCAWFWELESARFDIGRMEAAANDTGRLLIIETLMAYAADWYLTALKVPTGSLAKIEELRVVDTFGVTAIIQPVDAVQPDPDWGLWKIGATPHLLIPPPESNGLVSAPLEEWALVRDEGANLAWAIRKVPEVVPQAPQLAPAASPDADFIYEAMVAITPDRIALALVDKGGERRFKPAPQFRGSAVDLHSALLPKTLALLDDSLPDEGITLQRRYKFARAADGSGHLWVEFVKTVGSAVASSGLVFDRLSTIERA